VEKPLYTSLLSLNPTALEVGSNNLTAVTTGTRKLPSSASFFQYPNKHGKVRSLFPKKL
jgi:hypothetical protein